MITKKLKSLLDAITEAIRKSAPEFTVYILGQDEEPPDETYYFLIKFEKCNLKMVTNRSCYLEYYFDIMFVGGEIICRGRYMEILDELKSCLVYSGLKTLSGAKLEAKEYSYEVKLIDGVSHFFITYDFLVKWGDLFDQQNN